MTDRTAPVCGCETPGKIVRGMCAMHYYQWRHFTPPTERGLAPKFARQFNDFVDKSAGPKGCWLWTGPTDKQGYGKWTKWAAPNLAHRISLMSSESMPKDKPLACHHCDNPPCVNPTHLYWGTPTDNRRDFISRGGPVPRDRNQCKWGHDMAGDNVRIVGKGKTRHRTCRECVNRRSRECAARRREVTP